jgi:hypothetical protein
MNLSFAWHFCCTARKTANGFAPFAGVPPVLHSFVVGSLAGGTPNPLRSRGSEFNQLAPHTPERLDAPHSACRRAARDRSDASQWEHDASCLPNFTHAQDEHIEEKQLSCPFHRMTTASVSTSQPQCTPV